MATHILRSGNFLRPEHVLREVGIREGMHVVHFGCGPGFYVLPAARLVGTNGRVVGIDIRTNILDDVQKRARIEGYDQVDVVRADLVSPRGSGLPNDWADLVVLGNILHQSNPLPLLAEAARIVRPQSGRVLVVEWELVNIPLGPPVEQRVQPDTILAAARSSHLAVLRRWKPSQYHYGMLFAKAGEEL